MTHRLKFSGILFSFLLLVYISLIPTAALEQIRYTLNELKMNISVDDSFSVITRNTLQNDPVFENTGLDYNSTMKNFKDSGIYLQGISSDGGYMLTVNMSDDASSQSVVSYSRLNDEERLSLKESFLTNSIYTDAEISEINGNYYIVLSFKEIQDEQTIYGIQYNTVENGMNINITLQTSVAPLGDSTIWIINDAVKSIEFTEKAQSVSSFNPSLVILWLVFAVILIVAVVAIVTGIILRKKIPHTANGGFDNPQTRLTYRLTRKRADCENISKEQRKIETRRQMIENIDHGKDYDVFKDIDNSIPQAVKKSENPLQRIMKNLKTKAKGKQK